MKDRFPCEECLVVLPLVALVAHLDHPAHLMLRIVHLYMQGLILLIVLIGVIPIHHVPIYSIGSLNRELWRHHTLEDPEEGAGSVEEVALLPLDRLTLRLNKESLVRRL